MSVRGRVDSPTRQRMWEFYIGQSRVLVIIDGEGTRLCGSGDRT